MRREPIGQTWRSRTASRSRSWLAPVAATFVALFATAAFGAAELTWLTPRSFTDSGTDGGDPQIAIRGDGSAIATWERFDGTRDLIQTAVRTAKSDKWTVQDVSPPEDEAFNPQVVIDRTGSGILIWQQESGKDSLIRGSLRPAGSDVWQGLQDISARGGAAHDAQLAIDGSGSAVAVWDFFNFATGTPEVQTATKPAGGGWKAPETLSPSGRTAQRAQVAVGADGTAVAVWEQGEGGTSVIQAAVRPAGSGSWQVQSLSQPGQNAERPQVAVDEGGNAVAAWQRSNGSTVVVQTASRPAGGGWSAPQDISQAGHDAKEPKVAMAGGKAVAVWLGFDDRNFLVQGATRSPSGAWSAPEALSLPRANAATPEVALAPDGAAVAMWVRPIGADDIVQAASRAASGGSWRIQNVSLPGGNGFNPQISLNERGNGAATWIRSSGAKWIWQAADYFGSGSGITVTKASFEATWQRSLVTGRLVLTGTAAQPGQLRITLDPLADGASSFFRAAVSSGAFTQKLKLPSKLLPGRYSVRVGVVSGGVRLPEETLAVTFPAPPEGVVSNAYVAAFPGFPPTMRLPGHPTQAWANFRVAAPPKSGGFSATWLYNGKAVGTTFRKAAKTVVVLLRNDAGLPPGKWTCVLRAAGKVVAETSVRIG